MPHYQKTLVALAEPMLNAWHASGGVEPQGDDIRAWLLKAQAYENNAGAPLLLTWALQLVELLETGPRQGLNASDSLHVASYLRAVGSKSADFLAANAMPQEDGAGYAVDNLGWYDRPLYKNTNLLLKVLKYPYAQKVLCDLFARPDWSLSGTLALAAQADFLVHQRTLPFQRFGDTLQGRVLACLSSAMVNSAWKPQRIEADMCRQAWYFAAEPGEMPGRDARNAQRIGIFMEHLPGYGSEMLTFCMLNPTMDRSALEGMFPLPLDTIGTKAQLHQLVHMHVHRERMPGWGFVAELFEQHHPRLSQFIAAHLGVHVEGQDLGYLEEPWARLVADVPLVPQPTFSIEGLVMGGPHDQ